MDAAFLPLPSLPLPRRFRPTKRPLVCKMVKPATKVYPKRMLKQVSEVTVSYILNSTPKPPLICLHGFGASSFSFVPLLKHLPDQTLLAYDAPAFGLTSRPGKTKFYTPAFSATIAKKLAEDYSPNYGVLAHSMGALAAARLPDVTHLILIAPALLPRTLARPLARPITLISASLTGLAALLLSLLSPLLSPILTLTVRREGFWKAALTASRHPSHPPTEAIIQGYREPLQVQGWQSAILKFSVAALLDRARALREREDFVDQLSQRDCRIMIIHGEDDAIIPLDNSVRLAERLNASLVVLKECGHVPHEECPDIVAGHINHFLGRHNA